MDRLWLNNVLSLMQGNYYSLLHSQALNTGLSSSLTRETWATPLRARFEGDLGVIYETTWVDPEELTQLHISRCPLFSLEF